jgi:lysophospholipase L1-like esterase
LVATALLVGSAGSGSASSSDTRGRSASSTATTTKTYLSLGDSYAAGYQPPPKGKKTGIVGKGYANLIPEKAKKKGYDLDLVNFACGGATVESLANDIGCKNPLPGEPVYKHQSQLDAALGYLADHPGKVQLITVEIGGNDVTSCAKSADAIKCVTDAVALIDASLAPTLAKLRTAAGPDTTIVGLTYPDVILGSYLSKDPAARKLAELSVVAFQQLINPTLRKRYEAINATFVDVTDATGAYTPLTETTTLKPYGEIPVAVAKVCELSYFCTVQDIHATSKGYAAIADLIVDAIPAA